MTNMHYMEFGGGLGDVINQCYGTGNYVALAHIDRVTPIMLHCHNVFCREIFAQHPKHALLDIIDIRYGGYPAPPAGFDANEARARLIAGGYRELPAGPEPRAADVMFHPTVADRVVLDGLPPEFIALQPFSGTSDRDLPQDIVRAIDQWAARAGMPLVVIGRNYKRIGKVGREAVAAEARAIDCIDQLTIPGTIELVRRAALFVGGHSSMNLAAWHNRVRNYILFPTEHGLEYFAPNTINQWSFGRHYPETRVDFFADFSVERIPELLAP